MNNTQNSRYKVRVGNGFDAHKYIQEKTSDAHIVLAGEKIPSEYLLEAHSDGDVLLHALTDALLGAMAESDIGFHFPPSNNVYKNMASEGFLAFALELLEKKHGYINNIDVTLICEMPKISPYRDLIRNNLARICKINIADISVKATTTEKMGFTGRGEGIACIATICIELPRN